MNRRRLSLLGVVLLTAGIGAGQAQQAPRSVPLSGGATATPGITRTTLKDDPRYSVVRVHFVPGAHEEPHTHPYDIIVIPLENVPVRMAIGDATFSTIEKGGARFVPKDTVHFLANTSEQTFEVITVAIK